MQQGYLAMQSPYTSPHQVPQFSGLNAHEIATQQGYLVMQSPCPLSQVPQSQFSVLAMQQPYPPQHVQNPQYLAIPHGQVQYPTLGYNPVITAPNTQGFLGQQPLPMSYSGDTVAILQPTPPPTAFFNTPTTIVGSAPSEPISSVGSAPSAPMASMGLPTPMSPLSRDNLSNRPFYQDDDSNVLRQELQELQRQVTHLQDGFTLNNDQHGVDELRQELQELQRQITDLQNDSTSNKNKHHSQVQNTAISSLQEEKVSLQKMAPLLPVSVESAVSVNTLVANPPTTSPKRSRRPRRKKKAAQYVPKVADISAPSSNVLQVHAQMSPPVSLETEQNNLLSAPLPSSPAESLETVDLLKTPTSLHQNQNRKNSKNRNPNSGNTSSAAPWLHQKRIHHPSPSKSQLKFKKKSRRNRSSGNTSKKKKSGRKPE